MNDEAHVLSAVWMSEHAVDRARVLSAIDAVLDKDRAARARERKMRIGALAALVVLLPILVWAAAHGVTPLVRGAYALMAVGGAVIVFAEWTYLEWSRQALPGPADARSQLQKAAFMLARQVMLLNTAPIWSSPVFIGVALIGVWLYRERTHAEAFVIWTITAAGWLAMGLSTIAVRRRLNERKQQMEQLLGEMQ
jgi:hypothetical protein